MAFLDTLRRSSAARPVLLAVGVGLLVTAVLVATYFLGVRKPYAVLAADLRPADAATIVAALDKKKTPYRLENGGATIRVPKDQVDATRVGLAGEDLPLKGAVGFELFNKSDMGLTEFAQRINYQRALQGELARTIMGLEGIDTARVHLTLAQPTVFRDDRKPAKASVSLTPRAGHALSAETVRGVQKLVAAAVPDLEPDDVVIIDQSGAALTSATAATAGPQRSDAQAAADYLTARAQAAVRAFPGAEARVSVNAASAPAEGFDAQAPFGPGERTYPVVLTVVRPSTLPADGAQGLVSLAAKAVGFDVKKGDSLTVLPAVAQLAPAASAAPAVPPAATPQSAPDLGSRLAWLFRFAVVLALLIGAAVWLHTRGAPRPLSTAERQAMARKFEALLDENGDGVARQA